MKVGHHTNERFCFGKGLGENSFVNALDGAGPMKIVSFYNQHRIATLASMTVIAVLIYHSLEKTVYVSTIVDEIPTLICYQFYCYCYKCSQSKGYH